MIYLMLLSLQPVVSCEKKNNSFQTQGTVLVGAIFLFYLFIFAIVPKSQCFKAGGTCVEKTKLPKNNNKSQFFKKQPGTRQSVFILCKTLKLCLGLI